MPQPFPGLFPPPGSGAAQHWHGWGEVSPAKGVAEPLRPPPKGCFSYGKPLKFTPLLFSSLSPSSVAAAGAVPIPAVSGRLRRLVLRLLKAGCIPRSHPLCPPPHIWALPPAPSPKPGDFGAHSPAVSLQWLCREVGVRGGTCAVQGGAQSKPSPGEPSNSEPQNIRFPRP